MKITAVRIHNLASIGNAEIDFTKAPLRDAGLFAITGDTGAGKSTFLDAICLALYTKTARLKGDKGNLIDFNGDSIKLNDPRNLLRKGKWQGFAEVDFLGQDKQLYRARYSIQRTHKKATGKLKSAEHSLYTLPDETLIADKSLTLKQVERKIGLSFEQFSRAVLLAQHEFAAFLKATGDERAQLLECLTGTDKFSLIGKRIFERHKGQKDKLEILKASLTSYTLMSDDELAQKDSKLTTIKQQIGQIQTELTATEQALNWYKQDNVLVQELTQANQEQQQAHVKLESIAKQSELAFQAKSALEIKENRTRAQSLSTQNAALKTKITELKSIDYTAVITKDSDELKKHSDNLKLAKQQQKTAEPIIIKARELDSNLAVQIQTINTIIQQRDKEQQQVANLQQQLKSSNVNFDDATKRIATLEHWLAQHIHLKPLANDWSYFQHNFNQFLIIKQQLKTALEQSSQLQNESDRTAAYLKEQNEQVETSEQILNGVKKELNTLNQQQAKFNIEQCDSTLKNIDYLKEQRVRYKQLSQELKEAVQQQNSVIAKLHQSEQQLTTNQQQLITCEQTLKHNEQTLNQARLRASENVEHLRAQLIQDEPCAVCGATEHPFLSNQNQSFYNLVSDFESNFKQARQQYDIAQQALHKHQTNHAVLTAEHSQHSQAIQTAQDKQIEIKNTMEAARNELNDLSPEQLTETHTELSEQKAHYFKAQQQQRVLQDKANQFESNLKNEQQVQQKLHSQHVELVNKQQQQSNKSNELQIQIDELSRVFNKQFEHNDYWQKLQSDDLDLADLNEQVKQYQQKQKELEHTEKQLESAKLQIQQLIPILSDAEQTLSSLNDQLNNAQQQQTKTKKERLTLFGDEDISADEYQAKLVKNQEQCQTLLEQSQITLNNALKQRDEQAIALKNHQQRLLENNQELATIEARYNDWFNEFNAQYPGINHQQIADLLTLSNEQIKTHIKQHEHLAQALVDANATLKQQQKVYSQHQNNNKPLLTQAVLGEQLDKLNEQQNSLHTQQLEINTAIEHHNQNSQALSNKQNELTTLQKQTEQWHILNKVLGDATGKTMRNLAQTQTLKILLHYANSHLKTLNKRYELTAIAQSLDIAIIDRDMADEQRSVNTLSGGESFLVSLALALGLASLSSNKVQINSLFIDEGFGTLDSETLSVAMDALDSLQAQGRKVGVISHVSQMTERVATQINVAKKPGGYSTVEII